MKQHILHFNNYNHVTLTVASQEVPNIPGWYVLGMSLAHKNDNGSRFIGRNYATESLIEGLNDPYLQEHIGATMSPVFGEKGHYIIHNLEIVKSIMSHLRYIEWNYNSSKKNSVFHKAFFNLKDLWENHIKETYIAGC
jgi:hypothetical protein